jgi:hypothetical protein
LDQGFFTSASSENSPSLSSTQSDEAPPFYHHRPLHLVSFQLAKKSIYFMSKGIHHAYMYNS